MPAPIEIQGLSKRFGKDVLAVDRLDLTVEEGHIFGLHLVRRDAKQVTYRVYEEASSACVIEAFRTQAAGRAVYGVKQPGAWTRLPCPGII